jgi:hypothetical protein
MPGGVRRVKPFEENCTDGRKAARDLRRGLDAGTEVPHQGRRVGAASRSQILDVAEHVLQRVRVLPDDADPDQVRYNLVGRNRANAANILRHDQVRL